jgi:hypothetical protein
MGGGEPVPEIIAGPLLKERLGCSWEALSSLMMEPVMLELGYQDGKSLAEWVWQHPVDGKPHDTNPT